MRAFPLLLLDGYIPSDSRATTSSISCKIDLSVLGTKEHLKPRHPPIWLSFQGEIALPGESKCTPTATEDTPWT